MTAETLRNARIEQIIGKMARFTDEQLEIFFHRVTAYLDGMEYGRAMQMSAPPDAGEQKEDGRG